MASLQENEAMFSKNDLTIFVDWIGKKNTFLFTTSALLAVEWWFAYQVKGIEVLYRKIVITNK